MALVNAHENPTLHKSDSGSGRPSESLGPDFVSASILTGHRVISMDSQDIGKVSEIIIDIRNGRVAYAILSEGGHFGRGKALHAIPWGALKLDADNNFLYVHATAARIKEDPGFDHSNWPSMADERWAKSVHRFYRRAPYWLASDLQAETARI